MSKRKPKFRVGQVVYSEVSGVQKIDNRIFDPCEGWEYHLESEQAIVFTFEEDLRPLTTREQGPRRLR